MNPRMIIGIPVGMIVVLIIGMMGLALFVSAIFDSMEEATDVVAFVLGEDWRPTP